MTSDDHWNQEQSWAEARRPAASGRRAESDADEGHWAEDIRTGAAWYMQGHTLSQPQSGLGIVSLVMSLIAGLMIVVPLAVMVILMRANPNQLEDNPEVIGLACVLMLGLGLAVTSGIVGFIGLFQPERAKTCAILGTGLAALEVFGIAGLFLIGLLVG